MKTDNQSDLRRQRIQLEAFVISMTRTWPGVILIAGTSHLISRSTWFCIPAFVGFLLMLSGIRRTLRMVDAELKPTGGKDADQT